MKRLSILLGALLLLTGPIAGSQAMADPGHGRGRDRGGERYERRGGEGRGPEGRGQGRWQREQSRGGWEDRGPPRGPGRWADRYDEGPRYEPGPPRAYGARRGGYLPPRSSASVIEDYPRYRLRAPPRGFVWMRMGGGYGLVSQDTGQVFDVIPY